MSGYFLFFLFFFSCFIEISELNAHSVDPDQMPCSATSDLGLHFCKCPFYGTLGLYDLRNVFVL